MIVANKDLIIFAEFELEICVYVNVPQWDTEAHLKILVQKICRGVQKFVPYTYKILKL